MATATVEVIRGTTTISASANTATITEGVDYNLPAGADSSSCFIFLSNSRLTGCGVTSGGGAQQNDDFTVHITNPDNIATSITFERASSPASDCRLSWEIWCYVGAAGGEHEWIVRKQETLTVASGTTATGAAVAGVSDDNAIVVFITSQSSDRTSNSEWWHCLWTSDWDAANDEADFSRLGPSVVTDSHLSYVVIEFTGSSWRDVQRLTFDTTGTVWDTTNQNNSFTVSITGLGGVELLSVARTFMHVQYSNSNNPSGLDDSGDVVELDTTTTLRVRNRATAGTRRKVVWLVENTNAEADEEMIVEQFSEYRAASGSEERVETRTSANTARALSEMGLFGMCCGSDGSGNDYPRGSEDYRGTGANEITLTTSDTGQEYRRACNIIQFPRETVAAFNPAWGGRTAVL